MDVVDVVGRAGLVEVVARYEQMQQVIRERLDAELGPFAWEHGAAVEYGFTTAGMQIDTPGNHRTTVADPALGALVDFRSQVNTILQVTTGCHPSGLTSEFHIGWQHRRLLR